MTTEEKVRRREERKAEKIRQQEEHEKQQAMWRYMNRKPRGSAICAACEFVYVRPKEEAQEEDTSGYDMYSVGNAGVCCSYDQYLEYLEGYNDYKNRWLCKYELVVVLRNSVTGECEEDEETLVTCFSKNPMGHCEEFKCKKETTNETKQQTNNVPAE